MKLSGGGVAIAAKDEDDKVSKSGSKIEDR